MIGHSGGRESMRRVIGRIGAVTGLVIAGVLAVPLTRLATVRADGEPEPGFGVNGVMVDARFSSGRIVEPLDAVEMPDGSLVVSGLLRTLDTSVMPTPFVARYSATGEPDATFGVNGVIFPPRAVTELTPISNGQLVAIDRGAPYGATVLSRNGSISYINAQFPLDLVARPDGAVYAAKIPGGPDGTAAKLIKPDGTVDDSFVGHSGGLLPPGYRFSGGSYPDAATLLSDGRLIVAFNFTIGNAGPPSPCGLLAMLPDGSYDPTFGANGLLAPPGATACHVRHFPDDSIAVGSSVYSSHGVLLGALAPPFDRTDLAFEGTGWSYGLGTNPSDIVSFDPFGDIDPSFGITGTATLPGMEIDDLRLLDSGDILTWGTATGDPTALALGLIHASYGTALQPPMLDTARFLPVGPVRILDTRDGTGGYRGTVAPGGSVDLQITAVGGPTDYLSAVVLNVTATESTQSGFVTVYPSGTSRPLASNLNLDGKGQTAANLVTAMVGDNGKVTLYTSGGAQLIADVVGYYLPVATSTDGRFQATSPQRILDTREGLGAPAAKVGPMQVLQLQVTGSGPIPASGVEAVVLNLTADQADLDGFVTVWPIGTSRPNTSNLNLTIGEPRANLVIVPVGPGGRIAIYTSGRAQLIADVAGWFTDATAADDSVGLFVPIAPTRVLDTRQEAGAPTGPDASFTRRVGSSMVVPPDATVAVAATITVTQATAPGFITAWPGHSARPWVSNLNVTHTGQTIANATIVPLGQEDLALYTQSGAHIVVDIDGWFTNY